MSGLRGYNLNHANLCRELVSGRRKELPPLYYENAELKAFVDKEISRCLNCGDWYYNDTAFMHGGFCGED